MVTENRTMERHFLLPLAAAYGGSVLELFGGDVSEIEVAPSLLEPTQKGGEEFPHHENIAE